MSQSLHRSFVLLALTAALMAALLGFLPAAGHDQIWFLLMGRRWLGGATLYGPEIFDSNPPLVIWLSAIAVRIAELSHCEATAVAKCLVLIIGVLLAKFTQAMLNRLWPLREGENPALLFVFLALFFVTPARDLGQRDWLAGLLALPYVLASARPSRDRSAGRLGLRYVVPAALLAALGFCLKPQDALIAVAVELTCFLRGWKRSGNPGTAGMQGLRRPELLLLVSCGGLYLLAIRHWAPLYFAETLPILRATYWAIGGLSLPALLWQAIELTILILVTLLTLAFTRPLAPPVTSLLVAGLGAALAYLLQGTGWYYQQLPAIGLVGSALALHLLALQRRRPLHPPRWSVPALGGLCLLAVVLTTHFMGYPFTRSRAFALTSPDPALFDHLAPGTPVAILTTSVDEAMMPVQEFHITWAQRTDNLWLLPAILESEAPAPGYPATKHLAPGKLSQLEALQHRWMAEDLARWHPALILVERCGDPAIACQVLEPRHDDLLAWFQRDPAFNALWQHYHLSARKDRFDAYTDTP